MKKTTMISTIRKAIYRKDLVTQNRAPKETLLRIVKQKDGQIHLDWNQTLAGRGAYITNNIATLELVAKKNLLARAFRTKIEPEVYENLKEEFLNGPK